LVYITALIDLREQERIEREFVEVKHTLEQQIRTLEAGLGNASAHIEAISYTLAHDLRAPLRAMQGFASALVEDHGERIGPEGRDFAQRIEQAAERQNRLLSDLLSYCRLAYQTLEMTPTELNEVLAEVVGELGPQISTRKASLEIAGRCPELLVHRDTLKDMLAHLLMNALKFVPESRLPRVRVRCQPKAKSIRLWIEDNGVGIAPDHRERIFHIFERLDPERDYSSTGVGLAIVRKGAERMGGRCGVESKLGRGSRFWIELPKPPVASP
jgi:signal transduction histidine kinase